MKDLLIDSDVLIELNRGSQTVGLLLNQYQKDNYRLCISIITKYELIIGAFNKQDLAKTLRFLNRFYCYSLNDDIAKIAEQLLQTYALSHQLKIADCLIASTALYFDLPLLSRNKKDFHYIEKLTLISYPNF